MTPIDQGARNKARLRRQVLAITGRSPRLRRASETLMRQRMRWLRLPLGLLFVLGGIFSILPVLGLWMLPVGLILLAFDLPGLRGWVSSSVVRGRRRLQSRARRRRAARHR